MSPVEDCRNIAFLDKLDVYIQDGERLVQREASVSLWRDSGLAPHMCFHV